MDIGKNNGTVLNSYRGMDTNKNSPGTAMCYSKDFPGTVYYKRQQSESQLRH